MLNEVTIYGTSQTIMVNDPALQKVFIGHLGDKLTINQFTGITQGTGGFITYQSVIHDNQVGQTLNLGPFSINFNFSGGFDIGFTTPFGISTSLGVGIDSVNGSISYTNGAGLISGAEASFQPGGGAVLTVAAGILYIVTGGSAIPIINPALVF